MGIGAYQVRQYVLQLGGRVAVTSSPGAGTRFEMMLPTSRRVDTEEEETEGVQRAG
jgi:chemotaxis protein histidine kinase CheA